jgi:hypothetical protein
MSGSGDRKTIPFLLVVLLGIILILYLFFGPELFRGGFNRIAGTHGWDPIAPVLKGLNSLGDSIASFFSNLFR